MKKCSRCKVEKELICFSKSKNNKDGLDYICKACKAIESGLRRERNKKRSTLLSSTLSTAIKMCFGCMKEKCLHDFGIDKQQIDGRNRYCKKCLSIWRASNRLANLDKMRERDRIYRESHKEEYFHYQKQYREKHNSENILYRKEYNKTHKKEVASNKREWNIKHPDKKRAHGQKRRALKANAIVETFLDKEIFERDNYICGICGQPIDKNLKYPDPQSVSLDHFIPLEKDGKHARNNVQAAHLRCNCSKRVTIIPSLTHPEWNKAI